MDSNLRYENKRSLSFDEQQGWRYHMSNIILIGLEQLETFHEFSKKRRKISQRKG